MQFDSFLFFISHYAFLVGIGILSYGIGRRLTQGIHFNSAAEQIAFCTTLGLGFLSYLILLIGTLGLLYLWLVMAVTGVIFLLCSSAWIELFRGVSSAYKEESWLRWKPLFFIILTILIISPVLLLPLYPPTAFDSTMYHLVFSKLYVQANKIVLTPYLRYAVSPQTNEMLFSIALLVYDSVAAQLIQFLMMGLLTVGLFAFGQRHFSQRAGIWGTAILISNPMVLWLGASAYIDIGFALFVTMGIYSIFNWIHLKESRWLILGALFLGFSAGSKYSGLFFLILFSLVVLAIGFKNIYSVIHHNKARHSGESGNPEGHWIPPYQVRGRLSQARNDGLHKSYVVVYENVIHSFLFIGIAVAVASPWYFRNWHYTGNPVFPFFDQIFGYGLWSPQDLQNQINEMHSHGTGISLQSLLLLPWNLAFNQRKFLMEAPYSQIYLLALPFIFLSLRRLKIRELSIIIFLYTLFWFNSAQVLRYLIPIIPILSLTIAASFENCLEWLPLNKVSWMKKGIVTFIAAILLFSPGWAYSVYKIQGDDYPPCTMTEQEFYLTEKLPTFPAYKYLNQTRGRHYSVYALFDENMAYFADGTFMGDWFGPARFEMIYSKFSDLKALHRELQLLNANYFFMRRGGVSIDLPKEEDFPPSHFKLLMKNDHFLLFEVLD